ncbi:hypothetical protein D3C76_1006780 [compost metagenome]
MILFSDYQRKLDPMPCYIERIYSHYQASLLNQKKWLKKSKLGINSLKRAPKYRREQEKLL